MTRALDADQMSALDAAFAGHNLFLTGPAGCGKTYVMRYIVAQLRTAKAKHVSLVSSTGTAAIVLGGGATTLHAWLALGDPGDKPVAWYTRRLQLPRFAAYAALMRQTDVLVIDEVPMLTHELLGLCDAILRDVRHRPAEPFGGVQCILSGDFGQLPHVYTGPAPSRNGGKRLLPAGTTHPADPLFTSVAWRMCAPRTCQLTHPHRQHADTTYATLLTRVRLDQHTDADFALLKTRLLTTVNAPPAGAPVTWLVPTRAQADAINGQQLAKLPAHTEHTYTAVLTCTVRGAHAPPTDDRPTDDRPPKPAETQRAAYAFMRRNRAAPSIVLRTGARVMLCRNLNVAQGLGNGTLGIVTGFTDDAWPIIHWDGQPTPSPVPASTWTCTGDPLWTGTYTQVPVMLAWAMTIHKSQGATLSRVIAVLPANPSWFGAAYTAMSRVRTLADIWFSPIHRAAVYANPLVIEYYTAQ